MEIHIRITGKTWRRVAGVQASSAPLVRKMSDLSTDCAFFCILLPFAAWHRPPVSPWNLCFAPHQWEGHGLVGELWVCHAGCCDYEESGCKTWSRKLSTHRRMFGHVWTVSFPGLRWLVRLVLKFDSQIWCQHASAPGVFCWPAGMARASPWLCCHGPLLGLPCLQLHVDW